MMVTIRLLIANDGYDYIRSIMNDHCKLKSDELQCYDINNINNQLIMHIMIRCNSLQDRAPQI